jgi:hypothetical protein
MTRIERSAGVLAAAMVEWQKGLPAYKGPPRRENVHCSGRSITIDGNFGLSTGLKRKAA